MIAKSNLTINHVRGEREYNLECKTRKKPCKNNAAKCAKRAFPLSNLFGGFFNVKCVSECVRETKNNTRLGDVEEVMEE